jgi:hypothetical protein
MRAHKRGYRDSFDECAVLDFLRTLGVPTEIRDHFMRLKSPYFDGRIDGLGLQVGMNASMLMLNGDRLIQLPVEDSKANYLEGFWRWVELLAADDYQGALEALYWPKGTSFTP